MAQEFNSMEAGQKVQQETAVLQLSIKKPSFRKKVSSETFLEKVNKDYVGLEKSSVSVTLQTIDKKKFLTPIFSLHRSFIEYIKSVAIPTGLLGRGNYLVPLRKVVQIDEMLQKFIVDRDQLLQDFFDNYDKVKEDARERLGDFYDESKYPDFSDLKDMYRVEFRLFPYDVPLALRELNSTLYERMKQKVNVEWAEAAQDVRDALRAGFQDLVSHLAEKAVVDDETGKQQIFNASKVKNMKQFLETFEDRDLTNDAELASLASKAREILENVEPTTLRKDKVLKEVIAKSFVEIKEKADQLLVVSRRKFDLDDED